MTTLTVWKFPSSDGAAQAEQTLTMLSKQGLITVHDAAIVTWPEGKKKPQTKQLNSLTGAGALGGAFWGLLFGLIFFIPLVGLAVGAAAGALTGSLSDMGIDNDFIARIKADVQPGTSALFLLSSDAVLDRVQDAFTGRGAELLETNLSADQEATLRETFAE